MFTILRNQFGLRLFCYLMSLHLFNCVVDAPDLTGDFCPEELAYNDMESLIEVFAEQVLGYENYFPEYDDVDSEEQGSLKVKKHFEVLPFPKEHLTAHIFSCPTTVCNLVSMEDHFVQKHHLGPLSPPPWS